MNVEHHHLLQQVARKILQKTRMKVSKKNMRQRCLRRERTGKIGPRMERREEIDTKKGVRKEMNPKLVKRNDQEEEEMKDQVKNLLRMDNINEKETML